LTYDHDLVSRTLCGRVTSGLPLLRHHAAQDIPRLEYRADINDAPTFHSCEAGSLDEFLLEHYTAFNGRPSADTGIKRFFRIWHPPWPQIPIRVMSIETGLLRTVWPWFADARLDNAHYSPGLRGVWMGRPQVAPDDRM
jgi:hypothetical protein